jgi:Putative DNA-binding domain
MAQDDLFARPIDQIKFREIEELVTEQAEEGVRLEFKKTLSTSDGQPDRWMGDQSSIGRVARDDIATEVVAFANAYGGVVIIGIDETDDHPKRARQLAQIPRVADCAEQLARALHGIVDPPLPMLEVRGIASGASGEGISGEGVVVIRVGPSPSAPHGFGIPPKTYVRQGSESKPLSMRELQSMFFERRTRLERVTDRRNELSTFAQAFWDGRVHLYKTSRGSESIGADMPCIQFRCSLVPTDDLALDNLPDQFLGARPQRSPKPEIAGGVSEVVKLPEWRTEWSRRYRAVEHVGNSGNKVYWYASLHADGVVNQISIVAGTQNEPFRITPAWYAQVNLQGMILAEWLRRWASRPDVEYALDGEFWNNRAQIRTDPNFDELAAVSWGRARIGPYSVGSRATYETAFDLIERELWDAFGLRRETPLKFDLAKVFQSVGL